MDASQVLREFSGIQDTRSGKVSEVAKKWGVASDALAGAAIELVKAAKSLDRVVLKACRGNRIGGYGICQATGQERECFQVGVLAREAKIVVYQHGDAFDPKGFFHNHQDSNPSIKHGHLTEDNLHLLRYVQEAIKESYGKITGRA